LGTADLVLFKLTLSPNLPSLTIASAPPTPFSASQPGSQVAMIGYGAGQGESWGLNTVTAINVPTTIFAQSYITNDFETAGGTTVSGVTNNYNLIGGDSGGGDFIYNSSTQTWELAGVNEAIGGFNSSYFDELSTYSTSQIDPIIALPTPEPASGMFLACGLMLLLGNSRPPRSRKTSARS
jgi:hypothetical protein